MGFDSSVVALVYIIGVIGDLAYLYYNIAKTRNLISAARAIASVFIFLIALVLMTVLAYGFVTG